MANKSTKELAQIDGLGTLRYLMRGGRQRLDLTLGEAMVNSIKAVGLDIGNDINELRIKEHSVTNEPMDLTDFYYSSAIPAYSQSAWTSKSLPGNGGSQCMYASAFWPTSNFIFFSDGGRQIGLKLTYRIPESSSLNAKVGIQVNGSSVAEGRAGPAWRTLDTTIPGDCVMKGINQILITWPDEEDRSGVAVKRAADMLLARRVPRFHRVFGEIHSLMAFDSGGSADLKLHNSADEGLPLADATP
jgi:hypothetical protein